MSGELFVDTGAWYALQVPDDDHHEEAARTLRDIVQGGLSLRTTNLVIGETYTLLVMTHGHAAAWRFLEGLDRSARLKPIHVDPAIEREAYALLRRFSDQRFSYVDGTSFAAMRKHRVRRAFAFDRHFATAGFVRVPLDEAAREA